MRVDWLGWSHLTLAIAGIVFGGVVAFMRKGTPRHRLVGRLYGFSMLGIGGTAFLIYDLLGRFGPFHIAAIVSSVTVIAGWIPARRKKPRHWVEYHAIWMSWSYVGLLAALAAETLSRVPNSPFWGIVTAASLGVVAIGFLVIRRVLPRLLAPYRLQAERRVAVDSGVG